MIRPADTGDIPALTALGRRFHAASPVSGLSYDPEKVSGVCEALIGTGGLFVIEQDGAVKGMAGAIAAQTWFGSATVGQELFWWADGCGAEALELRRALEAWAKEQGCALFSMICLENPKADVLARLYRREGYRPVEHHFLKEL